MYSKIIIFLAIFSIGTHSYLIESPIGEEDVCNFEDRRLAESVRLVRSKYNCRVYYVCAFYKQYSLICAEGLYFDPDSNSCNYQEIVKCKLTSDDYTFQENSNASYLIEENQETSNKTNLTQDDSFDSYLNQTNFFMNSTEEVIFSTYSSEIMSNLTEADFMNESSNETFSSIDSQNISSTPMEATSTSSLPIQTFADVNNWWYGPSDCIEGFEHKLAHKENCALYFECTKEGDKIQKACPYPLQYDEMLNECRFYDLIECGTRKQAKDLCDYQINASLPSSIPCDKYPSCKDLSDGLYPSNDCKHYFQCKDERTLRIYSCPKDQKSGAQLKFNYLTKKCDFIENVSFNCGGYAIPIDIYTNKMVCPNKQRKANEQPSLETRDVYFSHPSECHLYVTCDIQGNMSILECFNGTHFSPYYQSCVHPSVVNCKKYPMVMAQAIYSLKSLLMEAKIKSGLINQTSEISPESDPIETTPIAELNTTMELSNYTNSTIF